MFRVPQAALATAVVVIAGVGVASPAHAATTVTIDSSGVASPSTVTDSQVTVVNNYAQDIKLSGSTFQSGGTSCSSINCTVTAGGNATYEVSPFAMSGEYVVAYAVSPVGTQTPIGGAGGTLNLFVTYSSGGGGGGGGGDEDKCPICFEVYGEGGCAAVVLTCHLTHTVCNACITKLVSGQCPHCRATIFPSAAPPTDPAPELTQQAVEQLSGGGVGHSDGLGGSDADTEGDDNEGSLFGNE